MTGSPTVSVVVPTYQRADRVAALLEDLGRQTLPPVSFEVVVVDDASTDGTADRLDALAPSLAYPIRVLRQPTNAGAGAARNAGLRLVRAPLVAFTDDDCHPAPDWLERGVAAFSGEVGIVQGRTTPIDEVAVGFSQTIEELSLLFEACNIFYRRDALIEAGGFREEAGFFFHRQGLSPIGEDTRAGWAVRALGWEAVYESGAHVQHDVLPRTYGWWLRYGTRYGHFAALAREFPDVRRELFWKPLFLRQRSAACFMALLGVSLTPLTPLMALLAMPWLLVARRPRSISRAGLGTWMRDLLFDAVVEGSLIAGSIRFRSPVL